MKCDKCGRDNLTAKELAIHNKLFHRIGQDYVESEDFQGSLYGKFRGTVSVTSNEPCPDCGTGLTPSGGCMVCTSCGYSRCGG